MCKRLSEFINKERTTSQRFWLILSANIIILVLEGFFAWLFWVSFNGRVTFGPLNSYIFIWLSIGIASMAALSSVIASFIASSSLELAKGSLKLTRDSLELTRATTRPFLSIAKATFRSISPNGKSEVKLLLCNTGALPANKVSIELELYQLENEGANETSLGIRKQNLPIFLPKEERGVIFSVAPQIADLVAEKGRQMLQVVRIKYQSVDKECNTFRTYYWPTFERNGLGEITLEIIAERDYAD